MVDGLGNAEINQFRNGSSIAQCDQDIARFNVPVNNPLLVGMSNRLADRNEELQPPVRYRSYLIAILGDRHAANKFHHKERTATLGDSSVVDLGNIGVIHQRNRLPFGFETGDDLLGIHPRFDDLQCHSSPDWFRLFRHVDDAHASFADLFQQLVTANPGTRLLLNPGLIDGLVHAEDRRFQEGALGKRFEKQLNSLPQCWLVLARLIEKCGTFVRVIEQEGPF